METLVLRLVNTAIALGCVQIVFLTAMIVQNAIRAYKMKNAIISEYIAFRKNVMYADCLTENAIRTNISSIIEKYENEYKYNDPYEQSNKPNVLGTYSGQAA